MKGRNDTMIDYLLMTRLKNGTEEPTGLVALIRMSVSRLLQADPISYYELVMKCRNPAHKIWSSHQEKVLKDLGIMEQGGTIHQSIVNIVLSGATGDGLDMSYTDPVAR